MPCVYAYCSGVLAFQANSHKLPPSCKGDRTNGREQYRRDTFYRSYTRELSTRLCILTILSPIADVASALEDGYRRWVACSVIEITPKDGGMKKDHGVLCID